MLIFLLCLASLFVGGFLGYRFGARVNADMQADYSRLKNAAQAAASSRKR